MRTITTNDGTEIQGNERCDVSLRPEVIIDALLEQDALVAGDIFEINPSTWAIHGAIPVDGEVILAEFDVRGDAEAALACLPETKAPRPDGLGVLDERSMP